MSVSPAEQRQARVIELRGAADHAVDRAQALELLAAQIDQHAIPVERWRPFWQQVARDCRAQARESRRSAALDTEHALLVEAADSARIDHQRGMR